jgi:hypothetical protein
MIRRVFGSFLAIIPLLIIPQGANQGIAHSHQIRVRVLDCSSEKPLSGIAMALYTFDDRRTLGTMMNGKTDSNGIVIFDLPDKVPLRVNPVFSPAYFSLCSEVEFATAGVLDTGLVGKNYCKKTQPNSGETAKPGELVIFATRMNPWINILRELL